MFAARGRAAARYTLPYLNPAGGVATKIAVLVTTTGAATQCELGIYNASAGAPGTLLVDGGPVPVTMTGQAKLTTLNCFCCPIRSISWPSAATTP